MNKFVITLLLGTSVSGCSTIFTNASEVEPGIYSITAHGNVFNSKEAMEAKALKKAEKKCGHANFARVGDTVSGNNRVYQTSINGYTNSPNVTIRVDCNAKPQ